MENISVNVFGVSTMCRLCLSRGVAELNIFEFSSGLMDLVADVIMRCAPVEITQCDEMPNFICQSCYTQLEKSHHFQKQVVQSDKKLRRYVQQLRISNKQIKTECPIPESSEDPSIPDTMKCESLELQDAFDFNIDLKEEALTNYAPGCKISEEMSLKSEIKEPPIDDDSPIPTECIDNLIDTLSGGDDGFEISREDSEIGEPLENNLRRRRFAKRKNRKKKTSASHKKHEKPNKIKYTCDICNKCFSGPWYLKIHKRIHTGEKPYNCDVCNMRLASLSGLKKHQRIHTGKKPFECNFCNKKFSFLCYLQKHKRIHTGEKLYQCDLCGKCLANSDSMKNHRLVHTGEKMFQCDSCDKSFKDSTHLKKHIRVHTGERPYQCDVCSKRFSESGSLRRHQRVHTGEKPFRCDICNKSFTQMDTMKQHQRIHTGEKPYQCDECDKRFARNQHLKAHLKGVHNKSMIFKCTTCEKTFKKKPDLNWHIQELHNVPK